MSDRLGALPLGTLVAIVAAFWIGLSAVAIGIGFLCERLLASRRIWDVPLKAGQYRFELVGNALFLAVQIAAFSLVLHAGLVRFADGSAALTFLAMLLSFQAYYYGLHRLMHLGPFLFLHRRHHVSQVTTPLTGHSMSVGESIGWSIGYLGLPMLLSLVMPVSFWGLFAYVVFNAAGNLIGHANFEAQPVRLVTRTSSLLSPPFVIHAMHHARWNGHYGFASLWMDRLFRTEWSDWPALHRAIDAGRPLRSLKARGDDDA